MTCRDTKPKKKNKGSRGGAVDAVVDSRCELIISIISVVLLLLLLLFAPGFVLHCDGEHTLWNNDEHASVLVGEDLD